jgi:hypothetical protein
MAQQQGKRSFAQTLTTGIGDAYIISSGQLQQIAPGDGVIVLDKDTRQRAEGTMAGLQANSPALNGMQRYDVSLQNMIMVPYQNVPLRRWGVAVI